MIFSIVGLATRRTDPIAWTCVQRPCGYDHSRRRQSRPGRAAQPSTGRDLPQGARRRHRTLRETSYADLTVRAVAARAKVAPATAYTYFSSKNHLIAEVYLDLVRQVPYFTDVNEPMPTRVDKALRHLALVVADEPEVAAACTTALLGGGGDPAVRSVRDRIGAEIHRRITSAIGPDADPRIVSVLEMTFFGALVRRRQRGHTPITRSPTTLPTRSASLPVKRKTDDRSDRQATPAFPRPL